MMEKEIEAKFLNVNHDLIVEKLKQLGAKQTQKHTTFRRYTYDNNSVMPHSEVDFAWVRLRDEGEKITLTYKHISNRTIHGVEETEVEVSDFAKTHQILLKTGLTMKAAQTTRRQTWELDGVMVMLDEWPYIPEFIEIEGSTESRVKALSVQIGMNWADAIFGNVDPVYEHYFDIERGFEITGLSELSFELPLPTEIEAKRK